MRFRAGLLTLLVLAATATCVRLGLWQLSRLHEKQAQHAAQRDQLSLPPIEVTDSLPAQPPAAGRRVHVRGRWDRAMHVLLSGRTHLGAAGVSLVTPMRLSSGEAVLVERGWLPAADSRIAHPEHLPGDDADLTGVAIHPVRTPQASPWVRLASDSAGVALWSARALEPDSAEIRVPGPLAGWVLRVIPDPTAPREGGGTPTPEPYEIPYEAMHLSYAIQWFAFAGIVGFGSLALAWVRARDSRRGRTT